MEIKQFLRSAVLAVLLSIALPLPTWAASEQLKSARLTDSTLASLIDNEIGNLETALGVIFGITLDANVSALFTITATGFITVINDMTFGDSTKITLGTGGDADLYYDGTDVILDTAVIGSGDFYVKGGSVEVDDSESLTLGTGKDSTILYDGTDVVINPQVVGGGGVKLDAGTLFVKEQADADADKAGYGQIWINTASPNELWFTDDAGTDLQLGLSGVTASSTTTFTNKTIDANATGNSITNIDLSADVTGELPHGSTSDDAANVHGLPANVNVLGNRTASGVFIQHLNTNDPGTGAGSITVYDSADVIVTFAVAFSAAPIVLPGGNQSGAGAHTWAAANGITTTGFTLKGLGTSASRTSTNTGWVALGT